MLIARVVGTELAGELSELFIVGRDSCEVDPLESHLHVAATAGGRHFLNDHIAVVFLLDEER